MPVNEPWNAAPMAGDRPLPEALQALAERVAEAVAAVLPSGSSPDLRGRVDATIASALERLELVPREEYERQIAALRRLEVELERLEARLAALEARDRAP